MPFPRPQFRLSSLLWLTLAVACFFGGMMVKRWRRAHHRSAGDDLSDTVFLLENLGQ
jgi:hypothetical protein